MAYIQPKINRGVIGMNKLENLNDIVWSNSNSGELFPYVATPMTFDVTQKFTKELLSTFSSKLGININKSRPFGLIAGKIYVNMNFAAALMRKVSFSLNKNYADLFGGDRESLTEALEIIKKSGDQGVSFSPLKFIVNIPFMALQFIIKNFSKNRYKLDSELLSTLNKYSTDNFQQFTDQNLFGIIEELLVSLRNSTNSGWPVVLSAMISNSILLKLFGSQKANIILSATAGMESADSGTEIVNLAYNAKILKIDETLISCEKFHQAKEILITSEPGKIFLSKWSDFMLKHGHHAIGEVDVSRRRWRENPDFVFSTIKSYLKSNNINLIIARYNITKSRSMAEEEKVLSKLSVFKYLIKWIINMAKNGLNFRENYKSKLVMMIDIIRKTILEIGRRLKDRNAIASVDDIFFINLEEAKIALDNLNNINIKELIKKRQNEYEQYQKVILPSHIIGEFDIKSALMKDVEITNENLPSSGSNFKGIPVSSGVVQGIARVIRTVESVEILLNGEILVAPFTDPGWTPFFVNAKGLVTELGGPLSHGSIIAREYGIPAVVNVKNITKIIKTGQLIEVDGSNGIVSII